MTPTDSDLLARTAFDARARLVRLQIERFEALQAGIDPTCTYMGHLARAIQDARGASVTAEVTEIAALRGDLHGVQVG